MKNAHIVQLVDHLRTPLYRNGYALVLSSAITSALGMVYWIIAARTYTADTIGLNTAVLSAMMFLAAMAQLNLLNAMNRFIPRAGPATDRLVRYAYVISLVMALLASLIFILGVGFWTPSLSFLRSSPSFIFWFVSATMAWTIFTLQDGVLTGLRQATWVPIENLIFAVVKITLLIGLATLFPQFGVFASWTIPVMPLVLPISLLIFWRLIPQHMQATTEQAEPIVPTHIVRYVAGDFLGSLLGMAPSYLLPIIVIEQVGPAANAYFFLSWTIAYSFYLLSDNMGMSLIAEAATDQTKLEAYSFQTFVQTLRLLVPTVAIMIIGAPYILRLFGNDYAMQGAAALRLFCLSAIPNIITTIYISIARVQRRMTAIFLIQAALSVLVLTLSYLLLDVYGITGVGVAWLLSQSIVAIALVVTRFRTAWTSN